MSALPLLLLLGAAVPDAVAGPDLAEQAIVTPAPISTVTVFSDRARVTRKGRVSLAKGIHALRLPDIPGGVMMDTVRVGTKGGTLLRVEVTPVERERITIEEVDALIARLEEIQHQIALLDAEAAVLSSELSWLSSLSPKPAVPEGKRVGRRVPVVDPKGWAATQDFVALRSDAIRKGQRALAASRRELVERLGSVQREMQQLDLGALTERRVQVVALVRTKGRELGVELEYFVPGAAWWPAYDVDYVAAKGKITLATAGLVRQTTGESWEGVRLELSTAIPGQGIDLPELLTWTLGEKKELIPRPRPESAMPRPPRHAMPQPRPIAAEADRAARRQLLAERVSLLRSMARAPVPAAGYDPADWAQGYGAGAVGGKGGGVSAGLRGKAAPPPPPSRPRSSRRAKRRSAPAPAPEPAMRTASVSAESVAEEDSGIVSALGSVFSGRDKAPVRRTPLGIFEAPPAERVRFKDHSLPAVTAGGLDYVFVSPTPATIPSSSERLRVPLARATWPAKTHYEATPALTKTAFLTARLKNKGKTPVLAGPVNIFMSGDFAGQGSLETTGPGGEIELPLGADEDIRLEHNIVPSSRTEGVFSKDDVTDYEVTLQIANHKRRAVEVELYDVLPKSVHEDVEIKLLKVRPKPALGPDKAKGRLTWRLDVPAGKTQKVVFRYRITRPENWQLRQR